jgi:hypothetical protein
MATPDVPPVLLLSTDLLVGSQVLGAARALGVAARQVQSLADLRAALASPAARVLVDLSLAGLNLPAVVELARDQPSPVPVVAFGPHVQTGLLAAARDAGCDEVLARGQFTSQLGRVLGGEGHA